MKPLGIKIKELRQNAKLSQANLARDGKNNSLISHIEKIKTKSPSISTLEYIAEVLEISFDELVKDTDYKPDPISSRGSGIAISQTDFSIKLEKDKSFTINRKAYPRYDINGNENKYCPKTGTPLLTACNKCKRPLNSTDSIYCMECGNQLFFDFIKDSIEGRYSFDALWDPEKLNKVGTDFLEEVRLNPELFWLTDRFDDQDADLFVEADHPRWPDEEIEINLQRLYNDPEYPEDMIPGADKWTADEFKKGVFSSIPEIVEVHTTWKAKLVFAREYVIGIDKIMQLEEDHKGENIDNSKNKNKSNSKTPL